MFEFILGEVVESGKDYIILLSDKLAYKIYTSKETLSSPSLYDGEVKIYTEFIVREDYIGMFGFLSKSEREFFKLMSSVKGIGAKTAISALSELSGNVMKKAVASSDEDLLQKAPGIGKKTAQRLILELKDKVKADFDDFQNEVEEITSNKNEAIEAMINLGYTRYELMKVIKEIDENLSTEDIIKRMLLLLSK